MINSQVAIKQVLENLQHFLDGNDDCVFSRVIDNLKLYKEDYYFTIHCVDDSGRVMSIRSPLNVDYFIRSVHQPQIKRNKLIKELRIKLNPKINMPITSYTDILFKLPEQQLLLDLDYIIEHLYEIFDPLVDNFPEVFY